MFLLLAPPNRLALEPAARDTVLQHVALVLPRAAVLFFLQSTALLLCYHRLRKLDSYQQIYLYFPMRLIQPKPQQLVSLNILHRRRKFTHLSQLLINSTATLTHFHSISRIIEKKNIAMTTSHLRAGSYLALT